MAARVLGRNITLMVNSKDLLLPIALGKIDEFSAVSSSDIIKRRPIGYAVEAATLRHGGYEISFKIGKNDPMLERWNHLVERGLFAGNKQPELFITEITKHYNGAVLGLPSLECWLYKNVTLFGLDKSYDSGDINQTIKGFATHKELGPVDTTYLDLNLLPGIGFQEVVHRTAQVDLNGIIGNILGGIGKIL